MSKRFVQVYNSRGFWVLVDRLHGSILGHSTEEYGGIPVVSVRDTARRVAEENAEALKALSEV